MPGLGYRDEGAKEAQVTHTLEGHRGYDCRLLRPRVVWYQSYCPISADPI